MPSKAELKLLVRQVAKTYGIPENLALAQIEVESSFRVNPPDAGAGAVGLGQVLRSTFDTWIRRGKIDPRESMFDPLSNLKAWALTMQENHRNAGGDWVKALRFYHGGYKPENWGPKTEAYVDRVLQGMDKLAPKNLTSKLERPQ